MSLKRADLLLKELGYAVSRNKAQTMIDEGMVFYKGEKVVKGSKKISEEGLSVQGNLKYVGRGALKLKEAFVKFGLDVHNKICMDIGASTGGFTQVLLESGAEKVYALDVGRDRLDENLKCNPKVINLENTNFRYIDTDEYENIEFISIDVSFISLDHILPNALKIIAQGDIVALLKPQYEGKNNQDKKSHYTLIENKLDWFKNSEYHISEIIPSPIRGKDGCIEYLLHIEKGNSEKRIEIQPIIDEAFERNREKK